jgi:uncharacterized protein
LLFTDPVHHLTVTPSGRMLLDLRDSFLSKRICEKFGGYALSQLKRIRTHRANLRDPSQAEPIREGRNPARAALEAQFGYDTKHAMHLVRLQRMGIEALNGHGLIVTRPDRDELLAIRDGAWSYEELEAQAEQGDKLLRQAAVTSMLPEKPNELALDNLCMHIISTELTSLSVIRRPRP